jgi:GNAT superfamily N-acetyltransferase
MNIVIRQIGEADYKKAHQFQCEYLDEESFEDFVKRVEANPDLYLIALDNKELIGICYGHPSDKVKDAINLQGIAVNLDETKNYARKGIGSKLMREFENVVKMNGFHKIDVGSADDLKVEKFYLKNGFQPYQLVAKGPSHEEFERANINDYDSGKKKQEELRKKYKPKEVIFIFEKSI